ncbi:hypothetical protein HOD75_04630 [archaeon]|jgi:hypothetical protein|nr:hypothetical protein [archaeon]MBT4242151.1 hypothetical protein [archaeon]MBT4417839.1 hypothetical protein [archaeon]
MKKRWWVVALLILITILLILLVPKLVGVIGNVVKNISNDKFICYESDDRIDYFNFGTVLMGDVEKGSDECLTETRLKEYYCLSQNSYNVKYVECELGCESGRCVEASGVIPTAPPIPVLDIDEGEVIEEIASLSLWDRMVNFFKD